MRASAPHRPGRLITCRCSCHLPSDPGRCPLGASRRSRSEAYTTWAIARRRPGSVLGRITLYATDLRSGVGELSYWLLPAARGHGVTARAATAVADWAIEEVRFHRIEIIHSTHNPASCRVADRAGFPAEGVARSALLHADGWHDLHRHARIAGP